MDETTNSNNRRYPNRHNMSNEDQGASPDDETADSENSVVTSKDGAQLSESSVLVSGDDELLNSEGDILSSDNDEALDSEEGSIYSEDTSEDDKKYLTPIKRPRYPTLQDVVGRETCNDVMKMTLAKTIKTLQSLAATWRSGRELTDLQGIIGRMILKQRQGEKRLDHDW